MPLIFALGVLILLAVWLGPLPGLARHAFSAHMTMHMAVVAVAAPLLAIGVAGSRFDPSRAKPWFFAPIPASVVELVVVWVWHAPALHLAARQWNGALVLEQGAFLGTGFWLWLSAVAGDRAGSGVVALLLTSMHMTLLGALFALAPRMLYSHAGDGGLSALADQHLGGAIMLAVGGVSYLAGGLWLAARLLRHPVAVECGEPS